MKLPVVNALWIGPRMGPVHAACLHSFVRSGHRVVLHCYSPPEDAPDGIETADARALLPESRIVRYRKGGSYSLFSNFFRFEVLRAGLGLYVDCDVYCIRPVADADYIFGWSTPEAIGSAILKMPADSPVVEALCRLKDHKVFIPPWFSQPKRFRYRALSLFGMARTIDKMPWGTTGPKSVTWYSRQYGIDHHAFPSDVFFPLAYYQVDRLFDPELRIEDLVTHRTRYIHLFHEMFRRYSVERIPPTSPAGRMIEAAGAAVRTTAA